MASGLNEKHTSVDTVIHNIRAVDLVLAVQISIVTLLNIINNGPPRLIVVDKVTETRGVNNSQSKSDTGFLNIGADRLNGYRLGYYVKARSLSVLRRVQRSVKKSIDESRLSQARFT